MLTQCLITNGLGTEQELAYAASIVSSQMLLKQPDLHVDWLNARFVKSVRKTKRLNQIASLKPLYSLQLESGLEVLGFPPLNLENASKAIKRTRVQGLKLPKGKNFEFGNPNIRVIINNSLGMSSGKLAAQVAHGVMLFVLDKGELPTGMVFEYVDGLPSKKPNDYKVVDAGLTELEPNSETILVQLMI